MAAADDVEILNWYVAVEPLLVDAGVLGSFAERESARCLASAEPYEGLLVRIANASLTSVDGYVSVSDGSGGKTLLGTTARGLRRRRRPRPFPGVRRRRGRRRRRRAHWVPVRELRRGQPRGDRGPARLLVGRKPNLVYLSSVAAVPARRELG